LVCQFEILRSLFVSISITPMPRRPRPAHRAAPGKAASGSKAPNTDTKPPKSNQPSKIRFADEESASEDEGAATFNDGDSEFEEGSSKGVRVHPAGDSDDEEDYDEGDDDEDEDADAPRVVQWEEDNEAFLEEGSEEESEEEVDTEVCECLFESSAEEFMLDVFFARKTCRTVRFLSCFLELQLLNYYSQTCTICHLGHCVVPNIC